MKSSQKKLNFNQINIWIYNNTNNNYIVHIMTMKFGLFIE